MTYYVPVTVLDAWDTAMSEASKYSVLMDLSIIHSFDNHVTSAYTMQVSGEFLMMNET